jgi:hypothetical protein
LSTSSTAVACVGGACDEVAAGTVAAGVEVLVAEVTDTYGVAEDPVVEALGAELWPVLVDELGAATELSQSTVIGTPLTVADFDSVTTCWSVVDVLEVVAVGVKSV